MIIGSDTMQLREYWGRATEVRGQTMRNWLKFAVACTAMHFLLVRVPSLFSFYFGDDVGAVAKSMGAQDQSQEKQLREVAAQKPKTNTMPQA